VPERLTTRLVSSSVGGFNPFESLSPRGPLGNDVILTLPSSEVVEGMLPEETE
ncbi:hypothetical protein Tco_0440580, partial [Tanacetum coccineum]